MATRNPRSQQTLTMARHLVAAGAKPAETMGEVTQGQVQLLVKKINEQLIAADERHASEQKVMAMLQDIMDSKASSAESGGIQISAPASKKEQTAQPPVQRWQIPEAMVQAPSTQRERMLQPPVVIDVLTVESVRESLSHALKETDFVVDAIHAVESDQTASGIAFTLKQKAHVKNPLPVLHMHVADTPIDASLDKERIANGQNPLSALQMHAVDTLVENPLKKEQVLSRVPSSIDRSDMIAPPVEAGHLPRTENPLRHRVMTVQNPGEMTSGHLNALLKITQAMMHPETLLSVKMAGVSPEVLAAFSVLYLQQAVKHSLRVNGVLLDTNAFSALQEFNPLVPSGGTKEGLDILSSSSDHDAMMNPFSGAENPLSLLRGAFLKARQDEEEENARMDFRFS